MSIIDISNDHSVKEEAIQFAATNIPNNTYMIKVSYNKINLERFPLENLDKMRNIVTGKQIGRASCRERVLRLV